MGGSLFCFVESKTFEFSVEEGGSFFLLRIFERGRNFLRSVFMGKECAKRMLSIMENFILSELHDHFARTVREDETVFIIQSGSNAHGYYLMISELLHGRRKGFLVIPEGRLGHGWRGFMWHLKKVLVSGIPASNRSPLSLPGAEVRADVSYAAAVTLDHRREPNDRRLAAEVAQGSGTLANPHLPFLNFGNHSSAKPAPLDMVSRNSCLGKEKDVTGLELSIAASDGTEGVLAVDLQLRLLRGPNGKWEVSWSKAYEVGSTGNQSLKPSFPTSPADPLKPKSPSTSFSLTPKSDSRPFYETQSPKPKPSMNPKPNSYTNPRPTSRSSQPISETQSPKPIPITNPKPIPYSSSNPIPTDKPKHSINPKSCPYTGLPLATKPNRAPNPKPNNKIWKPKPPRPNKLLPLSQLSPSLTSPSFFSVLGDENSDVELSSTSQLPMSSDVELSPTLVLPMTTDQLPSDSATSDASVNVTSVSDDASATSDSSDYTSENSMNFEDDGELQSSIQQILHQHTDEIIRKWGNSEQWVLELRNGKRVAVPIQISLPPGEDTVEVVDSNPLAIVTGSPTKSKDITAELVNEMNVFVEDWSSDFSPEKDTQHMDPSTPLNIDPLDFSLPTDTIMLDDSFLGKGSYSEWVKDKFRGFHDFLGTSLKGLEEPAADFLLAVENEIQQRTIKEKKNNSEKSSGRKGIRELRGLFSSVNYGATPSRRSSYGKDRALIAFQ